MIDTALNADVSVQPFVTRLKLTNFRNYESLDISLGARPVALFGPNGAGKTNLIEAVSFLGPGRGIRNTGASVVRRNTCDGVDLSWAVYAEAQTHEGPVSLATGSDPNDPNRRKTKLDGAVTTQAALARLFPLVWLTPREDRLWAGPRSDRLKFFDRLTLSGSPDHARHASAYEKAQRQRQKLLDQREQGLSVDPDWLDVLERDMALHGIAMSAARLDTLARLQSEIDTRPQTAFPKSDLNLDGLLESWLSQGQTATQAEDRFVQLLNQKRRRDSAAGRTLDGPHRTELGARHREKNQLAADCSTGEQKALILGLALAQAGALRQSSGIAPVLIFDEACAHLDMDRRAGLAKAILDLDVQAWLTGVERNLFDSFGHEVQRIEVNSGVATLEAGT